MLRDEAMRSLLDRYPRLLEGCERNKGVGWYPSGGEVYKFTYRPTLEAIDRFADHVFGGIGFEPDDYMVEPREFGVDAYGRRRPDVAGEALARQNNNFLSILRRQYDALTVLHPGRLDDWIRLANESYDFGGVMRPVLVDRRTVFSTLHALRVARRAIEVSALMRARQRPVRTLVEIGGGHGRATRDLVWMLEVETAFYVDLPLNMLLAARFLGHFFEERVNLVWDDGDVVAEGRINIVAPWLLDRIDRPVDLLVNFLSFQHMSMPALRYYGDRLIEPRVASIYHENRDHPRAGFEVGASDYPFRTPFELVHSQPIFNSQDTGTGKVLGTVVGELLTR